MGFVVFIAVLFVGGIVLAGWLAIGLIAAESRGRKKATANAPLILDAAFRGEVVTYDSRNVENLTSAEVVAGALQRGYTLVHDDRGLLTFSRNKD